MAASAIGFEIRRHSGPGWGSGWLFVGARQHFQLTGLVEFNRFLPVISHRQRLAGYFVANLELMLLLGGFAYANREVAGLIANNALNK
jgi:hypothetical protein